MDTAQITPAGLARPEGTAPPTTEARRKVRLREGLPGSRWCTADRGNSRRGAPGGSLASTVAAAIGAESSSDVLTGGG